jgi:hypothetical protein
MKHHWNVLYAPDFMEYNQQFSNRVHRGFNKVQKELVDMFDQRYK